MSDSLNISELSRGPAVKFEAIGDTAVGTIISVKREQQRDFDTGVGLTWDNGDPRLQTVIGLDTADGEVTLYAKGGKVTVGSGEGLTLEAAIVAAVRKAGASSIDPGAKLAVKHTGMSKPPKAGLNPTRLFVAQYEAPTKGSVAIDDDLFAS